MVLLAAATWPLVSRQLTGKWPEPTGSMDFQDGIRLEYEMDAADLRARGITTSAETQKALDEAKETFQFRLREFEGKKELSVRTAGDRSLIVEVPGVQDLQGVIDRIGNPQVLTFRVIQEGNEHPPTPPEHCFRGDDDQLCQDVGPPIMDYSKFDYAGVHVTPEDHTVAGRPAFAVVFGPKPAFEQEWLEATRPLYGKVLGICLDDTIMLRPTVLAEGGLEGQGQITGHFTAERALEIQKLLKAGPLRVKFDNTQQRQLSRSVGPEMLNNAFRVLGIGMAMICLILFLAYSNNPELFFLILLGQAVQASIVYFLSSQGYFALSLLSLCGLGIMSGVCIDNVILINEEILFRTVHEKVAGTGGLVARNVVIAVREAFRDEWSVVWRANLSSVLLVMPLYFLGEPVTGLVITMIVAIVFALSFVWLVVQTLLESDWVIDGLKNLSRPLRPALRIRFNLSGFRRDFRLVYGLAALGAIGLLSSRGLTRGIDFQPGTEITMQADREFDVGQLERAAADYFGTRCSVRRVDGGKLQDRLTATYLFLIPGFFPDAAAESRYSIKVDGLVAHLNANLPVRFVQKSSVSAGATVTGIGMQKFLICAGVGTFLLFMLLVRLCGFRVALSVVTAMLLDATVSLGALSLCSVQLSLPIVSSLLAIVGYSVYDSIVVAYHIRTDLKKAPGGHTADIVAETLEKLSRRMILTMASTTLSALGVALFCTGLLQDFGIIMAAGSVFGMMSTLAIVVPTAEAAYGEPEAFHRRAAVTA